MIDETIYDALKPLVNGNFYWDQLPEKATFPAIVGTEIANGQDERYGYGANYERYRIQFDVFARSRGEIRAAGGLREKMIATLEPLCLERGIDGAGGYDHDTKTFSWHLEFTFRERL